MEKTDFSEFSTDYEESLGPRHKYFIHMKCEEILKILKRYFGSIEGLRCLDLGCGTGEAEEFLNGLNITGIDYTHGMLKHAKCKKLENDFLLSSAFELPLKDRSFDLVFSMCMMHHITDDEKRVAVFKEAVRVLKNGGLLVIFEHNPFNPLTQYVVRTCPMDRDARLMYPKELKRYYLLAGFQSVIIKYILFMPLQLNVIRPIENAIGLLPMGGQYYITGKKP